jgi:hypothetical protein
MINSQSALSTSKDFLNCAEIMKLSIYFDKIMNMFSLTYVLLIFLLFSLTVFWKKNIYIYIYLFIYSEDCGFVEN